MSADSTHVESGAPVNLRKIVAASMAGTVVEWYEFFVYATAATLVFGTVFFPSSDDPLDGVIAALLTYAVGFVARPLGGLVFGHFGDKYGRKKLLQLSLVLVGASTFLMGCLPTFQQVGYLAPVLLVALRFVQGFAVGGEWGGAVLLVAEHSPDDRRGFWASFPQAGVPVGNLLATGVMLLLAATLDDQAFLSWGWRVAFFASAVVVLVGWYVRKQVEDAPIFKQALREEQRDAGSRTSVLDALRERPGKVATAMGLRFCENVMYYMVVTFTITYLSSFLGLDTTRILLLLVAGHAVHMVAVPWCGHLADRIGRRPVYLVGTLAAATYGFWAFPLFDTESNLAIIGAVVLGLLIHAFMYAPQPALMAEMFPTRMRYAGVSLGYQVTSLVAGSLAPVIATWLLRRTDGDTTSVALYLAGTAIITLIALHFATETRGSSLGDLDDLDDLDEQSARRTDETLLAE